MKKIFSIVAILGFVCIPMFVFGQNGFNTNGGPQGGNTGFTSNGGPDTGTPANSPINISIQNPFKGGDDLPSIVEAILNNIIEPLAAVVVVIMIIYSGFKFITAQGKSGDIEKAKDGLLYVLIGTLILLGAGAISTAIQGTLNQLIK